MNLKKLHVLKNIHGFENGHEFENMFADLINVRELNKYSLILKYLWI
jgi:hypothetical protein